jgi:hypothetical protein
MQTHIFLLILYIYIVFALWNIAAIKWKQTQSRAWNRAFHAIGLFVKIPPLFYIFPGITQMLWYAVTVWVVYDLVISLGISKVPFLVGTTAKTDILLGKAKFVIQGLLVAAALVYSIWF